MNGRKLSKETTVREYKTGRVEFQLPVDATFPNLMVFKENGNSSSVGFSPTPGAAQKVSLKSILKGGRGYCELWFTRNGVDCVTKKIQVGWGKLTDEKELEWEETAARYREIITYCRQRIHVHEILLKKAILHMRPVGREAHEDAADLFQQIHSSLLTAKVNRETLTGEWLDRKIQEAKEKEAWANGMDGVNPEPPEQKWYMREDGARKFLKAKTQNGFDRRPHLLTEERHGYRLYLHGKTHYPEALYCLEQDWNGTARGYNAWKPLHAIPAGKLGSGISGSMIYVKSGLKKFEICSFFVPLMGLEKGKPEKDNRHADLIAKIRKWKLSPPWAGWYHRHRWNRVLVLLGETKDVVEREYPDPMTMAEIENLAEKPWGYRWKEVLEFLRSQ